MLNVGRQIGDFVIERELGRGGMGIVYVAVNETTAERVAVKMLSPHLLPDAHQRRRFQREAYATGQIEHPGLVRVFGHGELEGGEPYILMEYLEGLSLRQVIQAAPNACLSIDAALQIALQLAEVLSSAHKSGLLHRDIKPSNVMLLGNTNEPGSCRVKLLDFGLARLLTETDGVTISDGNVAGTPAYMSPEQCEGRSDLDGRSDVYGLGALLFEMLCGRTPFVGPPPRMMYQHVYESVPQPEKFRPELAPEIGVLIQKMLAKARDSRPTMAEVAEQLRVLGKADSLPPLTPVPAAPAGISDKARLWIGILSLINVALLASLWRTLFPGESSVPARTPALLSAPLTPKQPEPASSPTPMPVRSAPESSPAAAVPKAQPAGVPSQGRANQETASGSASPARKAAPALGPSLRSGPRVAKQGSQAPGLQPVRIQPLPRPPIAQDAGRSPTSLSAADAAPPSAPPPEPPAPLMPNPAPDPVPASMRPKVEYWK